MLRAVQKIVRNGNSVQVTLPRPILFALELRPGEFVELTLSDDGVLTIRPWIDRRDVTTRSPGLLPPVSPVTAP